MNYGMDEGVKGVRGESGVGEWGLGRWSVGCKRKGGIRVIMRQTDQIYPRQVDGWVGLACARHAGSKVHVISRVEEVLCV